MIQPYPIDTWIVYQGELGRMIPNKCPQAGYTIEMLDKVIHSLLWPQSVHLPTIKEIAKFKLDNEL